MTLPRPSGSSVGVKGRDSNNVTLGGYISIVNGDNKQQTLCGLTCHHVIQLARREAWRRFALVLEVCQPAARRCTSGADWSNSRFRSVG